MLLFFLLKPFKATCCFASFRVTKEIFRETHSRARTGSSYQLLLLRHFLKKLKPSVKSVLSNSAGSRLLFWGFNQFRITDECTVRPIIPH